MLVLQNCKYNITTRALNLTKLHAVVKLVLSLTSLLYGIYGRGAIDNCMELHGCIFSLITFFFCIPTYKGLKEGRSDLLTIGLILYVYEFVAVQFVFQYFFNELVLWNGLPSGLGAIFLSLPVTSYLVYYSCLLTTARHQMIK
ncbi:unnamed protein product [Acanthoscelides obtectus]|uniref:Uncharacterized protein n=1 Tax=Acanthoscelides obtectus TaxID=200917 RepID=A0A9P0VNJ9_ACAOB|nr:unnamed protein product [Acanthoscelides obtectus]CAK1688169.1 hypothetical protein AOBTE_LOCUS36577 [Acanthoscelides obtectus]